MSTNKLDEKTGIDLAAVNHTVIDRYLTRIGLSTEGGDYARVVRLHDAMQLVPNKTGTRLGGCSTCRGRSHVDLACCPFCGDGAVDESVVKARGEVDSDPEPRALEELKELCVKKANADEAARAKDAAKTQKVAAGIVKPTPEGGPQGLVKVPPGQGVRSRRAAKKDAGQATIPAVDEAKDETPEKEATVEDLDNAVVEIRKRVGNAADSIYEAAVLLFDVFERKLWMQRRNDKGAPVYSNFTQWVSQEMPFSPNYAYELKDLPKYWTQAQVKQFGSTKLTLSLRISEEERRKLLESGDLENMSVRDVKDKITTNPASQPKNPSLQSATPGGKTRLPGTPATRGKALTKAETKEAARLAQERAAASPPARPALVSPEQIQVLTCVLPTKTRIELHTRGKHEGDKPTRARSLSDDPTGVILCANGAKIRLTFLVTTEGFLDAVAHVESATTANDDEGDEE